MIKILPKFTKADIRRMIQQRKELFNELILQNLQKVGEEFIILARESGSYHDKSGNLRSSIGYVILRDGFQFAGDGFVLIKKGGEGQKIGKKVIEEIARKYPTGWVLICVAGENYASAVEAKGFSVITPAAIEASQHLKTAMKRLSKKF